MQVHSLGHVGNRRDHEGHRIAFNRSQPIAYYDRSDPWWSSEAERVIRDRAFLRDYVDYLGSSLSIHNEKQFAKHGIAYTVVIQASGTVAKMCFEIISRWFHVLVFRRQNALALIN